MTKKSLCLASFALLLFVGQISAQAHYWQFDEGTGKIARDSKGGRKAVNGVLNNAEWRDLSKVGPGAAVRLTGADNSYVSFGDGIGQFGRDDFTVALWVQTRDTLALFDLVGNRASSGHGNFFAIRMSGDGYVSAEVDEDEHGTDYIGVRSTQGRLNDGNWHSIIVTRSGNTLTLYIDGKASNSGTARGTANIKNRNVFKLGRSLVDRSVRRFAPDALFDDLAIWDYAMGAFEAQLWWQRATNE